MLAAHATDVYHFADVAAALHERFGAVDLLTRYQWSQSSLDAFRRRVPLPRRVLQIAERRVQGVLPPVRRHAYLPVSQLYYPAIARLGLNPNPVVSRSIHRAYDLATARFADGADLLHGTEGMSARAFAARPDRLNVLEQRNYHYAMFEQAWPVHDGFPEVAVRNPLAAMFEEEYERADLIRVYSEGVVDDFVARGYERSRFAVVPLSVPPPGDLPAPAGPRPRDPYALLYVGRPDPSKGLDVASAATRLLGPPYTLTVAGPTTAAIRRWMRTQPHVRYAGILTRAELQAAYASHAFLLAPSVESFGLAVLEGYQAGIAVLCAPTTGVSEYLPDRSVRVLADRLPETWAAGVLAAVASGEWRDSGRGAHHPASLTPASVVRDLGAMYAAALERKGLDVPGLPG